MTHPYILAASLCPIRANHCAAAEYSVRISKTSVAQHSQAAFYVSALPQAGNLPLLVNGGLSTVEENL
jgi:hypothetical protein